MNREYVKQNSSALGRDMELLIFGDRGARVVVFPVSNGRFFDWEDRGMLEPVRHQIEAGDIQMICVDSVDGESWWNRSLHPTDRAKRHLQYQKYVVEEVLPFTKKKNQNDYVIALGASMGAYHAINIALNHPDQFNRTIGFSGPYDLHQMSQPYPLYNWIHEYYDEYILKCDPTTYIRELQDEKKLKQIKEMQIIFAMGRTDPLYAGNEMFTHELWARDIWHAYRVWDGFAHDWPYWKEMIQLYIGGPD